MTGGGRRPFADWGRFELKVLAIAALLAVAWALAGGFVVGLGILTFACLIARPGASGFFSGGNWSKDGPSAIALVRAGMVRDLCRRSYLDQTRAAGRQDDPDDDPKEGR